MLNPPWLVYSCRVGLSPYLHNGLNQIGAAVRRGAGTVVFDVRRGDGPAGCFDYTFSALATSQRLLDENPGAAAAAVRALVATQTALALDPARATQVGRQRFPAAEAALIAELIRRDVPYYSASITPQAISGMCAFARSLGLLNSEPRYEDIVATECAPLWH